MWVLNTKVLKLLIQFAWLTERNIFLLEAYILYSMKLVYKDQLRDPKNVVLYTGGLYIQVQ